MNVRAALVVCAACICWCEARALDLARDGRPVAGLVLEDQAQAAEHFAAEELSRHLERMTGAPWPIVREAPLGRSRILIAGDDELGPEEWRVSVSDEGVLLAGGRPRGALYAVYEFLERELGVRWWTPFESTVPARPDLSIDAVERRGRPAFAYRDVSGLRGPVDFRARHRLNGHFARLGPERGGSEAYGPPFHVHTFFMHAPPEELFEDHPEFYSEIDGERRFERAQLCLTNEELREHVALRIEAAIDQAGPGARSFGLSQNDWGGPCECARCLEVEQRTGSRSGVLLEFVNAVAARIGPRHPQVLIDTLAYDHTLQPPTDDASRTATNVVLRVAGLRPRDFLHPATHRRNTSYLRALRGWRERAGRLRVWDYAVTFGRRPNNFPLPNWQVLAADFRTYSALEVDGVFLQHEHPILGDLRDLKLWVVLHLLADPTRDAAALVSEFTAGFYGPAAEPIDRFLAALQRVAKKRRSAIRIPTEPEQFTYLDARFLIRSHALFDRAERAVADRPELLGRVREARISLDRATLWLWPDRFGNKLTISSRWLESPLRPARLARRMRESAANRVERYFAEPSRAKRMAVIDAEIARALDRLSR